MPSGSAREPDLQQVRNGATVVATDYDVGTVERVDAGSGGGPRLIVRHGYAGHLLAIPDDLIAEANPGMVKLSVHRSDVEALVYQDAAEDAGPTEASPMVDSVLGKPVIEPPDGPGTG